MTDKRQSADSALQTARRHYRAGRLAQAARICDRVLQKQPQHRESLYLLSSIAHRQGDFSLAADYITQAIALDGQNPLLYFNLGVLYSAQEKLPEALQAYRQALSLQPDYPQAWNNLGNLLCKTGEFDEGITSYLQAIRQKADYAQAWNNLGNALKGQNRALEALAKYQEAIHLRPDYAEARLNLGDTLRTLGRLDEAIETYQQTIRQHPRYAAAYGSLAQALLAAGEYTAAAEYSRQVITMAPDQPVGYNNLALILKKQGDTHAAKEHLRRAIELDPCYSEAFHNLALSYLEAGSAVEAIPLLRQAIALDTNYVDAHYTLALAIRHHQPDEDMAQLSALLKHPQLTDEQKIAVNFALGKAWDDCGDFEQAFAYFAVGNRLKRGTFSYTIEEDQSLFDEIKTVFNEAFFASHKDYGDPTSTPVFIVGMPRSGTSLVEQILASHPRVYGAGELQDLRLSLFATLPSLSRQNYPRAVSALDQAHFTTLAEEYLKRTARYYQHAAFVTDKMPVNFLYIGMIRLMFPRARIIHCRRNPVDTCLSCYQQNFTGLQKFAYDLRELGQYYLLYQSLMSHWQRLLPAFIYDCDYESLVSHPEEQIQAMLTHCNLEWDDRCLSFYDTRRTVKTASIAQVRRPIYKSSVSRWQHYEKHLEPLLTALHYHPD